MRQLFRIRVLVTLVVISIAIYRLGLRGWLASQQPWEWGMAAAMIVVLAACLAFQRIERTFLFIAGWFAAGLGATGACGWLGWYTWAHPASRNWFAIPVIGALAIFASLVFWYPLLSNLKKSTRLINRVQNAVESSDANAERYLWEAREVVGTGRKLEQMYLDAYEGKLRYAQGKPALAVEPLERAVTSALFHDDRSLGREAALVLVRALVTLSRGEEAARLTERVEGLWGEAPELRSELGAPDTVER